MLADIGADVVAVESPAGSPAREGTSAQEWDSYGANRRSVCLDRTTREGQRRFSDLLSRADIVVLSGRPAELAERDLVPEDLLARYPQAVITVITPFGRTGPKRDYLDTDLVLWAAGGPLEPHRAEHDNRPLRPSVPQAYLHAGADAAGGALIGYLAAQAEGRGQIVDVSVQASLSQATLARVLSIPVGDPRATRPQQPLTGLDRSGSGAATSGSFKKWQCRDGIVELHLAMGPSSGRFTNNFFAWVDAEGAYPPDLPRWDWPTLPDLIQRGEFTDEDLDAVRELTRLFLSTKTRAQVTAAAIEHRLLCVGINEIEDIAGNDHFEARGLWADADLPDRLVSRWVHVSGGLDPAVRRPAPSIGQHTDEVLREWELTS